MSGLTSNCGCCQELTVQNSEFNNPGLSAILYRIGTHGSFKSSMLKKISKEISLENFTSREDDDPSIALIDSWSAVLDVLSFYQERIANEGFIRTATEKKSILELARAIGYELNPGVAASTYLVFNLETADQSPNPVKISKGTKAQTIPGQDEKPQIFETVEDIQAYKEWNSIKVQSSKLWEPEFGKDAIYLKGTSTNLKKGDALLIVDDERLEDNTSKNWNFRHIISVETIISPGQITNYTKVIVDQGLGSSEPYVTPTNKNPKVHAFRQRASLFGYNAPDWRAMPDSIKSGYSNKTPDDRFPPEWPDFNIAYSIPIPPILDLIYLDSLYNQIVKDSWIVIFTSEYALYKVSEVSEESKTNFTLSSKTTRLKLEGENLIEKFSNKLRQTVVYCQSEELEIADEPIIEAVGKVDWVILDKNYEGFFEGQAFIISGKQPGSGKQLNEVVFLKRSVPEGDFTKLIFSGVLKNQYQRDSVTIYANVAKATNGESKKEILGNGDASKAFQKFTLKQKPVTYVSASTPAGNQTTLEVRVNDILWEEVPSFYNLSKNKRAYITRLADDGTVTVQFGDGINGSRLPTGTENIKANYRVGIGLDGLVKPKQISQLMTRPLGVKDVINPLAPDGAADPQNLNEARKNAPLTVLTLDRIVSLQDYEDFSRAFAGIGNSKADIIWLGENQLVHLTIAGTNGNNIDSASDLYKNLLKGINNARHPDVLVVLNNYQLLQFNIDAKVFINKNYDTDKILGDVTSILTNTFSFNSRSFGQPVTLSEVIALMQSIEGVIFIDLEKLYFSDREPELNKLLTANIASLENNVIKPAELLLVNPVGINLIGIIQ